MRTLHIVLSLDVGGLERVVLLLAEAAMAAEHRVGVICLDRRGKLADSYYDDNLPIWHPGENLPRGRLSIGACDHHLARQAIEEFSPDVVHTHQIGALYRIGKIAHDEWGLPLIHTEHGNHLNRPMGLLRRLKNRWIWGRAAQFCDRFCCVSEEIRQSVVSFGGVPLSKTCVVPNGVNVNCDTSTGELAALRASLGINNNQRVIGSLGRLSPVKRIDLLIRSFRVVADRLADTRLVIVGDGPCRREWESLAANLGLTNRVRFVGHQSDPHKFLAMFDVLAMSSESEGMPMAVLEAFAAHVPVVATRVGGLPSVVTHGKTGYLVDFGHIGEMAERLIELLENRPLRDAMSIACRTAAENEFSRDAMYRRYLELAHEQLARAGVKV